MRVSRVVIILLIIAGVAYFAHKKGYIGQAQQNVAKSFETHFQKGQVLFTQMKYQEAMEEFQKAIDLEPSNPKASDALFRIGHCYRDMRQKDKAIATYQKVIATYPDAANRGLVERALEQVRAQ